MGDFWRGVLLGVLAGLCWLGPFVGSVLLVYDLRGGRTLNGMETWGCMLISLPFLIIGLLVVVPLCKAEERM